MSSNGEPAHDKVPPLRPSEVEAAKSPFPSEQSDDAQKEAVALAAGLSRKQMAEQAMEAEHKRSEHFRDHFENLAIVSLWLFSLSLIAIAIVWVAHMLIPAGYRWLSTEDLSHIQSILTAGLLVGIVGNHFKKRLG